MSKSRLETPSQNKAGRTWLQPPGLANPADSRVLLHDSFSPSKHEHLFNPHEEDLIRQLNKVRRDISQSRQRLDYPNPQLNQSKSTDSIGTKQRLQFIQQKFKQKDELLLFQQTVIENLKKDLKHRDDIIGTIRERQSGDEIGKMRNSRQEVGMFRRLKQSQFNKHDRPESPGFNKSNMLSFIEDNIPDNSPPGNTCNSPYGEYNIRVFSSEEILSNWIGETQQQPTKQPEQKVQPQEMPSEDIKHKLNSISKQYEQAKAESKTNQIKLRKELNDRINENTKLIKDYGVLEQKQKVARLQLDKLKYQLESMTKLFETEKNQHQQIVKKTKQFDSVERNLRGALLAKQNQIRQLTSELNILRTTAKGMSVSKVTDQQLRCQLQATRIQLISKELECRDVQKICRKLQTQLSKARKDLQQYLSSKSRTSSVLEKSLIKIEVPTTSKGTSKKQIQEKSTAETQTPKAADPKKRKRQNKKERRHVCCSPETTISRSRSYTYYPVIKWNKVVH